MSFIIDFVGLAYFHKCGKGRLVLLPDGRDYEGIVPHNANFYIEKARLFGGVKGQSWWTIEEEKPQLKKFCLVECPIPKPAELAITFDAMAEGNRGCWPFQGSSIESYREDQLEHLKERDPEIKIKPAEARTIARLSIARGRIEAFALGLHTSVTRVTINSRGGVTITAKAGKETKQLFLRDEAEVVLANTSELFPKERHEATSLSASQHKSHFVIYEQLACNPDPDRMHPPDPNQPSTLPPCPSSQAFFVALGPQTPGADCGQTCCG